MRRTLLTLLAATAIAAGAPAIASAQGWTSIEDRASQLDQRIFAGIRSGQITDAEASRLRAEMRDVVRLEQRYAADGFTRDERADLDRRFDMISTRVYAERRDGERADRGNGRYDNRDGDRADRGNGRYDNRDGARGNRDARWENLNQRQAAFDQRLRRAVQDRRLTQRQADNLRVEFRRIARLERDYRRGGLTYQERADLDRRMDNLQTSFRSQVNANQYGYGYGQAPNLFDFLFGIR
jgi:hypothetical protein